MKRSPSPAAQVAFDLNCTLHRMAVTRSYPVRLIGRAVRNLLKPVVRKIGADRIVSAPLYGQSFLMPTEHPIAPILAEFPQYNRPLGMAAQAIVLTSGADARLSVVDVGANIGETIAIVEQSCPGRFSHLCIEPDEDLAELCRSNHRHNPRVDVKQCFIGEAEGASVRLEDDGRANSSTKKTETTPSTSDNTGRLLRLDTVAASFAEANGGIGLIKVDTEGYDFSVLRSATGLIEKYRPALYFEWYPELLANLDETLWGGFEFLGGLGYQYFVFYSATGNFYSKIVAPDRTLLKGLSVVGYHDKSLGYFDVFASTEEAVCDELVALSIQALDRERVPA